MTRIFILLGTIFALTACETAKGVGRDVENAGEAVQEGAADAQASI
ncbi:entericidin A/B family lipoprotein [Sulfitobacter sp. D35]|nr:entericidin A/B family lipoprotein [Sulfitobacter sp. D35]MDW4499714.1 entericidin A/B family lipoprotein [Sulfitobacter sp. D35]